MRHGLICVLMALSALLTISCNSQRQDNDWLIVPGERVGPISRNTSEDELVALFGQDNVTEGQVDLGEGDFVPGTIVFPKTPEQRLAIVWADSGRRDHVSEIQIQGKISKWHTTEGVTLGTTLKRLEQLNGKPFQLAGYGWDRSGVVCGMNQGRLTDLEYDPNDPPRKMSAQLLPDYELPETEALTRRVLGDSIFSSDHPAMQALNPRIGCLEIRLFIEDE